MLGSDFLTKYKTHDDPVTTIQPDATYRVVAGDGKSKLFHIQTSTAPSIVVAPRASPAS